MYVAERVGMTIKAFPAGHPDIPRSAEFGAKAVLVDGASPGSGEVFEWRLVEGVVDPSRLIVSGGLNSRNVGDAISHLRPMGVDVSTGVESSPGHKDPQKMREFVAAARRAAADANLSGPYESRDDTDESSDASIDAPYDWREE